MSVELYIIALQGKYMTDFVTPSGEIIKIPSTAFYFMEGIVGAYPTDQSLFEIANGIYDPSQDSYDNTAELIAYFAGSDVQYIMCLLDQMRAQLAEKLIAKYKIKSIYAIHTCERIDRREKGIIRGIDQLLHEVGLRRVAVKTAYCNTANISFRETIEGIFSQNFKRYISRKEYDLIGTMDKYSDLLKYFKINTRFVFDTVE